MRGSVIGERISLVGKGDGRPDQIVGGTPNLKCNLDLCLEGEGGRVTARVLKFCRWRSSRHCNNLTRVIMCSYHVILGPLGPLWNSIVPPHSV